MGFFIVASFCGIICPSWLVFQSVFPDFEEIYGLFKVPIYRRNIKVSNIPNFRTQYIGKLTATYDTVFR